MYVVEIIAKYFLNRKKVREPEEIKEISEETCSHVFLPLDSSSDYLACNRCGFVIENKYIPEKPRNFFIQ